MHFCLACTHPLEADEVKSEVEGYCKYCIDDEGNLKPYEAIKEGIAGWMMSWQPGVTPEVAAERAGHFMRALPAWADR